MSHVKSRKLMLIEKEERKKPDVDRYLLDLSGKAIRWPTISTIFVTIQFMLNWINYQLLTVVEKRSHFSTVCKLRSAA